MLFNSLQFLIFFPIVALLYYIIPRRGRYLWLLMASYYFYMSWNPSYALLMAFSTGVTYASGLLLDHLGKTPEGPRRTARRKWVVALSFAVNLSILVFFKYFDFLLQNLNQVIGLFHWQPIEKPFNVLLPVGISFYTFQALGYTMDVYRGDIPSERNFFKYALFVAFFPALVAGPIERSRNLLKQINEVPTSKPFDYRRMTNGVIIMIYGFFLKMVIADRIAIVVNTVYDSYYLFGGVELIAATMAFAIQIYCDFASYSTIAIGASEVLGFRLMENFNTPYFALSIQDFWRRWHVSLSTWFKDYLYIPLGGNRKGRLCKYRNIMITFVTSGLWHGADWSFLAWGFLHGAYQIVGDILKPLKRKASQHLHMRTDTASHKGLQMVVTFLLVCIAWVFFRADSVGIALDILRRMWVRFNPWVLFDGTLYTLGLDRFETSVLLVSIFAMLLVDAIRYRRGERLDGFLESQNLWFKWLVILGLLVAVLVYGQYGPSFSSQEFIYFQF